MTLLNCAPAVVAAVLDAAAARRRRARRCPAQGRVRVVVAGAPPPSKTIERVEAELGWEFIQIYGLTETSPLLTINRAPAEWDGLDAAERAKRLRARACPRVGVRMRVDAEGEVLARSNHVFEGYWEQPEETAKAIDDGWFHTGDGGYREDALVVISDRKKDVIITGGENVSSIEVEDCLFQHPAVRRGGGDRRARREVGRDDQGPRGAPARRAAPPSATSSSTAAAAWRTTSARPRSSSGTRSCAPRRASSRSSSCASRTGPAVRAA